MLGADAETYEKVTDVMDVWADSGMSHECVHHTHPDEVKPPVEIYLEGSDQHRGWFHSSLLMSEALYERAPYKAVLTHGFTVDEKGMQDVQVAGQRDRAAEGDGDAPAPTCCACGSRPPTTPTRWRCRMKS